MTPAQPFPGPLDNEPTSDVYQLAGPTGDALQVAREMLSSALLDVPRGAYDEQIIRWIAEWDVPTITTIASLMRRCTETGIAAGREEQLDERPAVARLLAENARLARGLTAAAARLASIHDALADIEMAAAVAPDDELRTAITTTLARTRRP